MSIIPTLVLDEKDLRPFIVKFQETLKESRPLGIAHMRVELTELGYELRIETFPAKVTV